MGTTNRGHVVIPTLAAIHEFGELTAQELADYLDIGRYDAHAVLNRMAKRTKAGVKRLHIVRWIEEHEGARRYPRAVFAIGDKPDAPKPRSNPAEVKRRYEQRRRLRNTTNSVFNLGLSRKEFRI
jgi:hypothetical protein